MRSHTRGHVTRVARGSIKLRLGAVARVFALASLTLLAVQPASLLAQSNDALVVDTNGKVGIGKAPDPNALLDVGGMIKSQELNSGNDALVVKGGNVHVSNLKLNGSISGPAGALGLRVENDGTVVAAKNLKVTGGIEATWIELPLYDYDTFKSFYSVLGLTNKLCEYWKQREINFPPPPGKAARVKLSRWKHGFFK